MIGFVDMSSNAILLNTDFLKMFKSPFPLRHVCLHQNQIHAEAEKTDEKPQVPLFRTKKKRSMER